MLRVCGGSVFRSWARVRRRSNGAAGKLVAVYMTLYYVCVIVNS